MASKTTPKTERRFQELESNFFLFKEAGDKAEGVIKRLDDIVFVKAGKESTVGKYELVDDDGNLVTIHGSTQMDDKLRSVPDGAYVRIEYVGEGQTSSGQKLSKFKVEMEQPEG